MLNKLGLFFTISILSAPMAMAQEEAREQVISPLIVELFSSQACLFCPEADNLLTELAKSEDIIVFSCHVDYFDIQPSPLSLRACTTRQNAYVRQLASGTNYTPQIIINGITEKVGYEVDEVKQALESARSEKKVVHLPIERSKDSGDFSFMLPKIDLGEESYQLYMVIYKKPLDWEVKQGVHKGKIRHYERLARTIEEMSLWNGEETKTVFAADIKESDAGVIIFAQNRKTGDIVVAGEYDIEKNEAKDDVTEEITTEEVPSEQSVDQVQSIVEGDETIEEISTDEKISPVPNTEE